jgi:hypothetical protein
MNRRPFQAQAVATILLQFPDKIDTRSLMLALNRAYEAGYRDHARELQMNTWHDDIKEQAEQRQLRQGHTDSPPGELNVNGTRTP